MIAYLRGRVLTNGESPAIILCGEVGYAVFTTPQTLTRLGEVAALYTYLSVRENALELFGFETHAELRFFEKLLSVPGIGPRSALGILGMAEPAVIASAIAKGDGAYLTSVSGIGRKTAEKIVVELKDTMAAFAQGDTHDHDALEALKAMGYSAKEAANALREVPLEIHDTGKRISDALRRLGKPS